MLTYVKATYGIFKLGAILVSYTVTRRPSTTILSLNLPWNTFFLLCLRLCQVLASYLLHWMASIILSFAGHDFTSAELSTLGTP